MEYTGFLFFLFFIAIVVTIHFGVSSSNKEAINRVVSRNGGQVIEISSNFFAGNKGTYTYKIAFQDGYGKKYRTTCQVNKWVGQIFWTETPRELMSQAQQILTYPNPYGVVLREDFGKIGLNPEVKSSKEQIIDDLHEENTKLKAELERLRRMNDLEGSEL